MLEVLDTGTVRRQHRRITVEAGVVSEGTAGQDRRHDEDDICAHTRTERQQHRRHQRTDAPGIGDHEGQQADDDEGDHREHRAGHNRLAHIDEELSHLHLTRDLLEGQRSDQQDDDRQHIREALHEGIPELREGHDLPGDVHHHADEDGNDGGHDEVTGRHGDADENCERQDEVQNVVALFLAILGREVVLSTCIAVGLARFSHTLVGRLHSPKLREPAHTEEEDDEQRHDRVDAVRNRHHVGADQTARTECLYTVLLQEDRAEVRRPGRKRNQNAHRRAGTVEDVRQRLTRHLFLIIGALHRRTDGQHVQIIIDKDDDTEEKGREQRLPLRIADARDDLREAEAALRRSQQRHETAEQSADQDDIRLIRHHLLERRHPLCEKRPLPQHQRPHHRTRDEERLTFLCHDRADDDYQHDQGCYQSITHHSVHPFPYFFLANASAAYIFTSRLLFSAEAVAPTRSQRTPALVTSSHAYSARLRVRNQKAP